MHISRIEKPQSNSIKTKIVRLLRLVWESFASFLEGIIFIDLEEKKKKILAIELKIFFIFFLFYKKKKDFFFLQNGKEVVSI